MGLNEYLEHRRQEMHCRNALIAGDPEVRAELERRREQRQRYPRRSEALLHAALVW